MLQRRELAAFRKQLLAWFKQYKRDLPWRRTKDPYRTWLSEIMLQQTRVAAVIPYYERFLERFPDVHALATAPQEEVLRLWSGLGYYSRARNLQRAAQEIVARHDGAFPRTEKEALALPGIGSYTAAAILSIAYGAKHAVLDGNVARVLARIFAVRGDLRDARRWQSLQESADALLAPGSPSDWNQAMMELGATLCTPQSPQCLLCPVTKFCQARKLGLADSIPARRKKRATENIVLAAAVLLDPRGRTLLLPPPTLSKAKATHEQISILVSKLWHFPTIAVRIDPTGELRTRLHEILPASMTKQSLQLEPLPIARHAVTYRAITLRPFRVTMAQLPRIAGAKIIPLADVASPSAHAISNLTRKAARAALAGPAALAARA
ncbi:MAG: A/G-specific adenine glycosylase [Candidatus Acidoferrum typicum]|nr:A/G-specific adenine glycosylase [Candidatus Acidoferrum typicum]